MKKQRNKGLQIGSMLIIHYKLDWKINMSSETKIVQICDFCAKSEEVNPNTFGPPPFRTWFTLSFSTYEHTQTQLDFCCKECVINFLRALK